MVGNCNSTANVIFISAFIESREQQILLVLLVVVVSLFFTALLGVNDGLMMGYGFLKLIFFYLPLVYDQ